VQARRSELCDGGDWTCIEPVRLLCYYMSSGCLAMPRSFVVGQPMPNNSALLVPTIRERSLMPNRPRNGSRLTWANDDSPCSAGSASNLHSGLSKRPLHCAYPCCPPQLFPYILTNGARHSSPYLTCNFLTSTTIIIVLRIKPD